MNAIPQTSLSLSFSYGLKLTDKNRSFSPSLGRSILGFLAATELNFINSSIHHYHTMEGEAADFHDDWELLLDSPEPAFEAYRSYDMIGDDSGGLIRADYFSIDGYKEPYDNSLLPCEDPADSPDWVDPGCDSQFVGRKSDELRSDSGSDLSDELKLSHFGLADENQDSRGFEGLGTKVGDAGFGFGFGFEVAKVVGSDTKTEVLNVGFEETGEMKAPTSAGGDGLDAEKFDAEESRAEQKDLRDEAEAEAEAETAVVEKAQVGDERRIVWWKVPFELLRYCALRAGPVWSLSVAAAVVGLVILTRRLHKMKQKSRTLQLKITLDDKKVSLFKSRAARLNEAFSVVKRVPVVRPVLPGPAAGVVPSWPMVSLR
ncbi:hypothetical protein SAY87_024663 [Trapa incisa]|uniref:DUF6821 domain-containing protein n=1 Tax=Trapa incisa TaxID=236973 RepID=A0AAN7GER0_9MYRT|nr:hypothetical protein SAY87_024663 [Trapa incisa]